MKLDIQDLFNDSIVIDGYDPIDNHIKIRLKDYGASTLSRCLSPEQAIKIANFLLQEANTAKECIDQLKKSKQ